MRRAREVLLILRASYDREPVIRMGQTESNESFCGIARKDQVSTLNSKDLHWFRLANSNPPSGFYAFKERFLKRFATFDGFDLQKIERECHSCGATGFYEKGRICHRCDGSGVYDIVEHWLARYQFGDAIYHKPMDHADVYHLKGAWKYPEPKAIIEGRIKHSDVAIKVSSRAFDRLLLRHEPLTFYNLVMDRLKYRVYQKPRSKLVFCLIRLRNKMDLFKAVEDEIPF